MTPPSADHLAAKLHSRAYGDWLAERTWTHVVHLSPGPAIGRPGVERCFRQGVRRLESFIARRVDWVCTIERGSRSGLPHAHALLFAHGRPLLLKQVEYPWRATIHKVERFDPERGAVWYITKGVGDGSAEIHFSRCLPPLRAARDPVLSTRPAA